MSRPDETAADGVLAGAMAPSLQGNVRTRENCEMMLDAAYSGRSIRGLIAPQTSHNKPHLSVTKVSSTIAMRYLARPPRHSIHVSRRDGAFPVSSAISRTPGRQKIACGRESLVVCFGAFEEGVYAITNEKPVCGSGLGC